MAKEFNYNYYGVETTVWPSNGDNVASMVGRNTWYYYDGGNNPSSPNAPNWGKPYDSSVSIWRLEKAAPYANKGYVCILPGDRLNVEVKLAEADSTVPLIMQATTGASSGPFPSTSANMDWATGGRIDKRLGYDTSMDNNSTWSRLCYDINPQMFCLFPAVQCYNKSNNSVSGSALAAYTGVNRLKTYIDADPDNRDVTMIRYDMYYGGNSAPRDTIGQYITQSVDRPTDNQKPCVPLCEPYCDCPLPDYQPIKDAIQGKTGNDDGHPDWEASKIFNPFIMSPRRFWYDSSVYIAYNQFYTIGFNLSLSRDQYRDGREIVRDKDGWPIGDAKITAQWIRGNFERKDFDDVSYHWRWYIWDTVNKVELPNGFNLSNLSSNSTIRVMSELVIDDFKGQSKGEALERAVKHETAYTGFWFVDTPDHAANGTLNDTSDGVGIFLPKRINGIPNGEYYTGEEIADAPEAQEQSTGDWYNDGQYDPISGDEGDWTSQEHIRIGAGEGGPDYWVLNDTEMNNFVTFVNTSVIKVIKPDPGDYPDTPEGRAQYEADLDAYYQAIEAQKNEVGVQWGGADPFNYIVCCKWYPWEVDDVINSTHETIHIAQVNTSIETPFLYKKTKLWDMGSFNIAPRYHNWKDYQIQINLMLPFIGTMGLDPQLYVGHTVNVKYSIDWRTGDATAYIYRDGQCMDSASGSVGIDIPLTLAAAGTYQAQIGAAEMQKAQVRRQATLGALSFASGLALSLVTGGFGASAGIANAMVGALGRTAAVATLAAAEAKLVTGVAKAGLQFAQQIQSINYQIDHTPLTMGEVSSASPFNNITQDYRTALIITYPAMQDDYVSEEAYGKTVGHACCRVVNKIKGDPYESKYKGYIQATNAILDGIPCRTEERQTIASLLQSGIINNT